MKHEKHTPTSPHKKFIADFKELSSIVSSSARKLDNGNVSTKNYANIRKMINEALQARTALEQACKDYTAEHPGEDVEILSDLIELHSARLKGIQKKADEYRKQIEKSKEDAELKCQKTIDILKKDFQTKIAALEAQLEAAKQTKSLPKDLTS